MNQTIPSNLGIELLRMFTVLLAGGLSLYMASLLIHWRTLPYDLGRKLRYLALFGYGLMTALQEVEQLGEPLLVWRLPLLLLCTIAALLGNLLPDLQEARQRPLAPVKRFEWPFQHKDEEDH